jgi:hypothetical protein
MKVARSILAAIVACATARTLGACPYCASEIGQEVRAAIVQDFATNATLTLLPLGIMLLVVGLIHIIAASRLPGDAHRDVAPRSGGLPLGDSRAEELSRES